MTNQYMNDYAYTRSQCIDHIELDGYRFREDGGVAYFLTSATRGQYTIAFDIIGESVIESRRLRRTTDEILENKWFIHAYDLFGNLN